MGGGFLTFTTQNLNLFRSSGVLVERPRRAGRSGAPRCRNETVDEGYGVARADGVEYSEVGRDVDVQLRQGTNEAGAVGANFVRPHAGADCFARFFLPDRS